MVLNKTGVGGLQIFTALVLSFFIGGNASAALLSKQLAYYGKDFYSLMQTSASSSEDILLALNQVLDGYHISQGTSPDIVANRCSGNGSACYRHQAIGYGSARVFLLGKFYLVKESSGYGVKDVYCDRVYSQEEFGGDAPAPNKVPSSNVVNVEHTWPQSRFTGSYPREDQKSDLHHLFPTDSQLNSIRGNNPFGEVLHDEIELKCSSGARFGSGRSNRESVFEPPQNHKGNVARALFYFSTRYNMDIDQAQESDLRKWHHEDPVDEEELKRNEEIFKLQGNRNPFIDFPELVDRIQDFRNFRGTSRR